MASFTYNMHESDRFGVEEVTSMPSFSGNSFDARRFQAITEHLFSMLSEEAVILSLKNGKYYGLNPVGVSIWHAIKEPATLAEIETAIMQEYEVDHSTCQTAVAEFLEKMIAEELIKTIDG